jgi:AICAR transformylase/IMP cyclohydrolase PurH
MRRRVRGAHGGDRQARQSLRRRHGGDLAEAWDAALRCDPVSAFGGIVAVNRTLDEAAAEKIAAIFTEVIVAPDATAGARADPGAQAKTCACC